MKELTLTLTLSEINAILQGVSKLPWAEANPIIVKIQEQAKAQTETPT